MMISRVPDTLRMMSWLSRSTQPTTPTEIPKSNEDHRETRDERERVEERRRRLGRARRWAGYRDRAAGAPAPDGGLHGRRLRGRAVSSEVPVR